MMAMMMMMMMMMTKPYHGEKFSEHQVNSRRQNKAALKNRRKHEQMRSGCSTNTVADHITNKYGGVDVRRHLSQ